MGTMLQYQSVLNSSLRRPSEAPAKRVLGWFGLAYRGSKLRYRRFRHFQEAPFLSRSQRQFQHHELYRRAAYLVLFFSAFVRSRPRSFSGAVLKLSSPIRPVWSITQGPAHITTHSTITESPSKIPRGHWMRIGSSMEPPSASWVLRLVATPDRSCYYVNGRDVEGREFTCHVTPSVSSAVS